MSTIKNIIVYMKCLIRITIRIASDSHDSDTKFLLFPHSKFPDRVYRLYMSSAEHNKSGIYCIHACSVDCKQAVKLCHFLVGALLSIFLGYLPSF